MKRLITSFALTALLSSALLNAQEAKKEAAKEAEQTTTEAKQEAAPAGEAKPAETKAEQPFRSEVELGVRWIQGINGNLDTYRSMINLGEGPRVAGWDMKYDPPSLSFLKKAEFRGSGWGGDPSSWMQFRAEDPRYYRFTADHRSTAYFNAMPSFANPLLDRGILANQRSFDTTRRFTELQVDILPTSLIIPYVSYMRDRGFGRGVTSFVSDSNEYPVLNELDDATNLYRGGVRMETRRFHLLLEQGGIQFRDGQQLFNNTRNNGNATRPVLGQTLFLRDLLQAYDVSGSSIFSRGAMSAQPVSWVDLSGAFQFSQPRNDIDYRQTNTGLFVDLDSLLFLNGQNIRLLGASKQPHMTANLGGDVRIGSRVRYMQSWMTDRLHNATALRDTPVVDRLEWNYSQQQSEVLVDLARFFTVRGGYRYVWGDGVGRSGLLGQTALESGQLKRHVALAGAVVRIGHPFSVHFDSEIARSDRVLYRTSLTNYERFRMRARYQLKPSTLLYAGWHYLDNQNPPQLNSFDLRHQQQAVGIQWLPGGKSLQLLGEYARSAIRSNLDYLTPQMLLTRQRSFYRENAHTITAMATLSLPATWTWQPKLSFGGSAFLSSGSRPTEFYQPVIRLTAPLVNHLDLFSEYRWYGVSQTFYAYEGFRTHQGIVGLRIH
ncbi:MAG: hypothetical protein JNL98_07975 [Bryobacterales bacterium]|nr:hypothetical protein [Bryobacterales bacterium]